jgi:hypothetical protein
MERTIHLIRLRTIALLLMLLMPAARVWADEQKVTPLEPEQRTHFDEVRPRPHQFIESFQYVAYLYLISTPLYLLQNHEEVFNNATLQSYAANFGNIAMFDQDQPSAGWVTHFVSGAVVYQFYRARSYTLDDSFYLTLIQELLFQFTVETLIQPTAMEDIVGTSVMGTIIGRSLEVASLPMLNSDFWLFRGFGRIVNLPTLFGLWESTTQITPIVGDKTAGLSVRIRF